jgi:probable HAF family extracellular repeat protein
MHQCIRTIVLSVGLLWASVGAAAQYTFTPLAVPNFAATNTRPSGVNDQGHVVGVYTQGTLLKSFYYDGSAYHDVQVGDCVAVYASGINNNGEIVGTCQDTHGTYPGFVLAPDGTFALYLAEVPGASAINLLCVNGPGAMAGSVQQVNGIHGVLTDRTTWTLIDVPGGSQTQVFGINDSQVIVGWAIATQEPQPAVYSFLTTTGVTFTRLQYPGAEAFTYAQGISNAGQVVGSVQGAATPDHGFLFDGTTYTRFDIPGAAESYLLGISPDGSKLIGTWNDGVTAYAFLATSQTDATPPVITATATPAILSPPNGKLIPVTVTGTILDSGVGVDPSTATYAVLDEYGLIQPTGPVSLQPNGSYRFTVSLQASRRGQDQDGRYYAIALSAKDLAGNPGVGTAAVVVPHG